jgi:hypothetical protein
MTATPLAVFERRDSAGDSGVRWAMAGSSNELVRNVERLPHYRAVRGLISTSGAGTKFGLLLATEALGGACVAGMKFAARPR